MVQFRLVADRPTGPPIRRLLAPRKKVEKSLEPDGRSDKHEFVGPPQAVQSQKNLMTQFFFGPKNLFLYT